MIEVKIITDHDAADTAYDVICENFNKDLRCQDEGRHVPKKDHVHGYIGREDADLVIAYKDGVPIILSIVAMGGEIWWFCVHPNIMTIDNLYDLCLAYGNFVLITYGDCFGYVQRDELRALADQLKPEMEIKNNLVRWTGKNG